VPSYLPVVETLLMGEMNGLLGASGSSKQDDYKEVE
jgi:hypothetical protein